MILLLLAQVFSGAVFQGAQSEYSPAANCEAYTQSVWDGYGLQYDPFEVAAVNTSSTHGCIADSPTEPTVIAIVPAL